MSKKPRQSKQVEKPIAQVGQDSGEAKPQAERGKSPTQEKSTLRRTPDGRMIETDLYKNRLTTGFPPGVFRRPRGFTISLPGHPAPAFHPLTRSEADPDQVARWWHQFLLFEALYCVRLRSGANFWDLVKVYEATQSCESRMHRSVFRDTVKSRLGDLVEVLPDPAGNVATNASGADGETMREKKDGKGGRRLGSGDVWPSTSKGLSVSEMVVEFWTQDMRTPAGFLDTFNHNARYKAGWTGPKFRASQVIEHIKYLRKRDGGKYPRPKRGEGRLIEKCKMKAKKTP
jgi:hypothetical protein